LYIHQNLIKILGRYYICGTYKIDLEAGFYFYLFYTQPN
jgi:hypothetical protein